MSAWTLLGSGQSNVSDGRQRAAIVEPVDPCEGFPVDGAARFPWTSSVNDVCLEQADHCSGECIAKRTTFGVDVGFQPGIGWPFAVFDQLILVAAVTLVAQIICRLSVVMCLFQCIQKKLRLSRFRCPPANDFVGEDLAHKGDAVKSLPCRFQTSRGLFGDFDRFCPIRTLIHNHRANLI